MILDRTKQPVSGKPKDILFPDFYETKFDNGIKLFVISNPDFPLTSARFLFKTGSCHDVLTQKKLDGTASMTADLLTKGTKEKSAVEIAEIIDYHGAVISSGADYDASYLGINSLDRYFEKMFDLVCTMVLGSAFSDEEIERKKLQVINSLLSYRDDGGYLAESVFRKMLYGSSPYAADEEGTMKSVASIGREDITEYYKNFYVPSNLVIALVGNISAVKAEKLVFKKFGDLKAGKIPDIKFPELLDAKPSKVYLTEKKGAVQSNIHAGHTGINRNCRDFVAITVMNTILGGSFTSRINKNLREVNGYTYGARSSFNWKKYQGDFSVEVDVRNDITSDAVKEIIKELVDISVANVTHEELQTAQNYITGNFPMQLETPNAVASKLLNLELYGVDKDFYNKYISEINSLTLDDIRITAEKYLHPDSLTISVAGDTAENSKTMKQFGEIRVIHNIDEIE